MFKEIDKMAGKVFENFREPQGPVDYDGTGVVNGTRFSFDVF